MPHPDFRHRLLPVLRCQDFPDRVPLMEAGIALPVKEQFLGKSLTTLEDEVEFWSQAGYDFLPLEAGLRTIIDAAIHHEGTGRFEDPEDAEIVRRAKQFGRDALSPQALSTASAEGGKRTWAPEGQGMITSLEDFEVFPWPTADDLNYRIFSEVEAILPEGMEVIVFAGAIFSSLMLMMGMEEGLIGMMTGSELFQRLLKRVGEFQVAVVEKLMAYPAVGAVWVNDDMGFKSRTLVNPELFRRYTFPYYREIKAVTARHDRPLLLHSDGNITLILKDLAEIGFNAIHPIEPEAMNIVETRKIIGPEVCLIGNLSLGFPLGTGTPDDVRRETTRLIQTMAPCGGYCLSSGNSIPDYVPYKNWRAMRDTALEVGRYPIRRAS